MLFSGKGGVGKTTLAAATAIRLARGGSRVLIVSTDPAHSLGDAFDIALGAQPLQVAPNLEAMEIDAGKMFSFAEPPSNDRSSETSSAFSRLLRLASQTPGVDEFGAIEVLLGALEDERHDVVVLDTAPTGHTLRLLTLPELLDGWLGTLLQLRHQLARTGRILRRLLPRASEQPSAEDLASGLQGGRERIVRLREVLGDAERAQLFLVTIPEAMSVLETMRTLELLRKQHLAVGAIIINQLQPEGASCVHCERRRRLHELQLGEIRRQAGAVPVRVLESQAWDLRGYDALARLADLLWGDEPKTQPLTGGCPIPPPRKEYPKKSDGS